VADVEGAARLLLRALNDNQAQGRRSCPSPSATRASRATVTKEESGGEAGRDPTGLQLFFCLAENLLFWGCAGLRWVASCLR
jgi:hypothetical protein